MIPAEVIIIVFAFIGAAAGSVIGGWAEHRLAERKFAREAARVTAAPYDWKRDGI